MYKISGRVIKGEGYGKKLGFPTVNLATTNTEALPPEGVYAGIAVLDDKEYRAGIVVGPGEPPTPKAPAGQGKIEAHLIGYDGDAYGKEVTLKIGKFLREFKKFDTEEELIIQIKKDIKICSQA